MQAEYLSARDDDSVAVEVTQSLIYGLAADTAILVYMLLSIEESLSLLVIGERGLEEKFFVADDVLHILQCPNFSDLVRVAGDHHVSVWRVGKFDFPVVVHFDTLHKGFSPAGGFYHFDDSIGFPKFNGVFHGVTSLVEIG